MTLSHFFQSVDQKNIPETNLVSGQRDGTIDVTRHESVLILPTHLVFLLGLCCASSFFEHPTLAAVAVRSIVSLPIAYRQPSNMLGGFSTKFGPASFAPPASVPAPQTIPEWITTLNGVKSLYLQRQYKQCAVRCNELLTVANGPVSSVFFVLSHETDSYNTD